MTITCWSVLTSSLFPGNNIIFARRFLDEFRRGRRVRAVLKCYGVGFTYNSFFWHFFKEGSPRTGTY